MVFGLLRKAYDHLFKNSLPDYDINSINAEPLRDKTGKIFAWMRPRGMPTLRSELRDNPRRASHEQFIPDSQHAGYHSGARDSQEDHGHDDNDLSRWAPDSSRSSYREYPSRPRPSAPMPAAGPQNYPQATHRPIRSSHNSPIPPPPAEHRQHRAPSESGSAMDVDESLPASFIWDGFPDGQFSHHFTLNEAKRLDNLMVHWAYRVLGGKPNQSATSETWQGGKTTRRQCLGSVECDNDDCEVIVRPQTTSAGLRQQLSNGCNCGGTLLHTPCSVISVLYTFKHGVHYVNGGTHEHPRHTHRLHLSRTEQAVFVGIVTDHPRTGPLKLLVGLPGANGPGKSVAEISPVLINADRIKHEKKKALGRGNGKGPDGAIADFAAFETANPGFIRHSSIGKVTVITMQTPFMAELLVKEHHVENESVNGIVSDATYSYFVEPKALLFMSSVYAVSSRYWVPGLISYSNGGSAEHYRLHFLQLILSVAEECIRRQIPFTNDKLANILDFSEAERLGFIYAFVDYWMAQPSNDKNAQQLFDEGSNLLKGCVQHFHAQIQRLGKITGVVHPSKADIFQNYARKMLEFDNVDQFTVHAEKFIAEFPLAENWIRWWIRPSHSRMLFKSHRTMTEALWDSLPATTNAQEAQHLKLYSALEKNHLLLPGLAGLVKFVKYYELLAVAQKHGTLIRYGQPETWKDKKNTRFDWERWGGVKSVPIAKTSRAPGASSRERGLDGKTDSRPPDTGKDLLGTKRGLGRMEQQTAYPKYISGCPWQESSCWLDTSLQLFWITSERNYESLFKPIFAPLPSNSFLSKLANSADLRIENIDGGTFFDGGCPLLRMQRNGLRKLLVESKQTSVSTMTSYEALFSWLFDMFGEDSNIPRHNSQTFLTAYKLTFKCCVGTPTDHWQLSNIVPEISSALALTIPNSQRFSGNVEQWFKSLTYIHSGPYSPLGGCWWATADGQVVCEGHATALDVLIGLPIMLILEIRAGDTNDWDIPQQFSPIPSRPSRLKHAGVVYDLVGHGQCNTLSRHFAARFLSPDCKRVYNYDGMQHHGHAILTDLPVKGSLTGKLSAMKVPSGFRVSALVYHLRGGVAAQTLFTQEQSRRAKKIGIEFVTSDTGIIPNRTTFNRPNTNLLEREDLFWLTTKSKSNKRAVDWVAIPPIPKTPSPQKKKKPISDKINAPPARRRGPWAPEVEEDPSVVVPPVPGVPLVLKIRVGAALKFRTPSPIGRRVDPDGPPSPWPIDCSACGTVSACGSADDGNTMQCDACRKWSHVHCVEATEPNLDIDDLESLEWICSECVLITGRTTWNPNLVGQYIMLESRPGMKQYYPAKVLTRKQNDVTVEWYPGNSYRRGEKPPQKGPFSVTALRCISAYGRVVAAKLYNKSNCGQINWPYRLIEDAADIYSYTHPEITKALTDARAAVAAVIHGKLEHPVWSDYQLWIAGASSLRLAERSQRFTEQFNLDILPGDYSLISDHVHFVVSKSYARLASQADTADTRMVMVDLAMFLFKLVVLRVYLGRSWGDDFQIYHLAHILDEEQLSSLAADDPFANAKCGRIIHHSTVPEQVLLAAEETDDTRTALAVGPEFCRIRTKPSAKAIIPAEYLPASAVGANTSGYTWAAPSPTGLYQEPSGVPVPRPRPRPLALAAPVEAQIDPAAPSTTGTSAKRRREKRDDYGSEEEKEEADDPEANMDVDNEPPPPPETFRKTRKRGKVEKEKADDPEADMDVDNEPPPPPPPESFGKSRRPRK